MTSPEQQPQGGPESPKADVPLFDAEGNVSSEFENAQAESKSDLPIEKTPLSKEELDVLLGTGATPHDIRAMSLEEARRLAKDIPERERETNEKIEAITGISNKEAHRRLAENEAGVKRNSEITPSEAVEPLSEEERNLLSRFKAASSAEKATDRNDMSHAERREAYTKKWEDMTEEEQKAKYEKTFEIRDRFHEMQKARANFAVLENELSKRNSLWGKVKEKLPGKKDVPLEDLKNQALLAEQSYKEKRAQYVGAKTWRALKDGKRLAEDRAKEHQKGNFEKFRKGWRWMGDKNIDALLTKFGRAPKSKWGKIAARSLSLRTGVALGLMASGGIAGFAGIGAAGTAALGMRRAWSGIGTGVGLYDLMRNFSEKKTLSSVDTQKFEDLFNELSEEEKYIQERPDTFAAGTLDYDRKIAEATTEEEKSDLLKLKQYREGLRHKYDKEDKEAVKKTIFSEVSIKDIEEQMARLEALAAFSGEKIVQTKEYKLLQKAYMRKSEAIKSEVAGSAEEKLVDAALLQQMDDAAKEAISEQRKKETRFKVLGLGAGLGSMVLSQVLLGKILKSHGGNVTPEDLTRAIDGDAPVLTPEQIQEAANTDGTVLPDVLNMESPTITPGNKTIILETVNPASDVPVDIPESVGGLSNTIEATAESGQYMATIEHGSNIWDTAKQMIKDGTITEEQFMEAWTNPESVVELPDGSLAHISDVGLVHEGDQVVFLAGNPPRFTACDSVMDVFKMANNVEYAKMLVNKGVPLPAWLKESVAVRMPSAQEISVGADALFSMNDAEFVEAAYKAGQTGGDIAIYESVSSVDQEVPVGASPTDSEVPFPGEASENVGASATDAQVPFPGEDLPTFEPPAGTPDQADVINSASQGSLEVRDAIVLEGHQAQFLYDGSGNIADFVYSSTMNSQERARFVVQSTREYLDEGYVRSLERTVPDSLQHIEMGKKIAYAQEAAAEMAVYNQALSATEPNSPEFYFLKYRISEFIHFTERQILDARIFNRRALSATLRS